MTTGGKTIDRDSLDAIDDQIGSEAGERLAALEAQLRAARPEDDQATRLRRLVEQTAPRERPNPVPAACSPVWTKPDRLPARERRARVVTVASGKGGVGKTNIAVNLAIALAARDVRVALLDADLGTANADVICGVRPTARLDHVLGPGGLAWQDGGRVSIRDIAVEGPGGFLLVPGSAGLARMADLSLIEQRRLLKCLSEMDSMADVVVVDAAAGVGRSVTGFVEAADLALIVTTPEPTALADAYALIKCVVMQDRREIRCGELPGLSVVVNQAKDPLEAFGVHARLAGVCAKFLGFSPEMAGFVAQDLRVAEAVRAQCPVFLRSPESAASRNISELAGVVAQQLGVGARQNLQRAPGRGLGGLVRRVLGISSGPG